MSESVPFVVAITGLLGSFVGFLGWYREAKKDKRADARSDVDILVGGFKSLLDTTTKEAERRVAQLLDCEERAEALNHRVELLEKEVRRLGGTI